MNENQLASIHIILTDKRSNYPSKPSIKMKVAYALYIFCAGFL